MRTVARKEAFLARVLKISNVIYTYLLSIEQSNAFENVIYT